MGIAEILTIVFIILKLVGTIGWNWFLVLLPEVIAVIFYILFFIFIIKRFNNFYKHIKAEVDKYE